MSCLVADRYLRDQEIGIMADRLDSERLRGFDFRRTDGQTDICDCRVAFATEREKLSRNRSREQEETVEN